MLIAALLSIAACTPEVRPQPSHAAEPDPTAVVGSLSPMVATVRTVGWWSDGAREGPYRVVIVEQGFDEIVSRLYLQWLVIGDDPSTTEVVATVGFDQLNEVPRYSLEIAAVRDQPGGLEVEVIGASPYTGETGDFLIRADLPGAATVRARK